MQSVVGKRFEKFLDEQQFRIGAGGSEEDGQGALWWKGTHVGFVYYEDEDHWKFYPADKGGIGLFGEELEVLGRLMTWLQEKSESEERRATVCKKRTHMWEDARNGVYVCIDCNEPGFFVSSSAGSQLKTRADAVAMLKIVDLDDLRPWR